MNVRPHIVAIINITRDSFSDGGRFLSPQAAIAHAHDLVASGASIIELGPASSNPDAAPVSATDQIERIAPVLDALTSLTSPSECPGGDTSHGDVPSEAPIPISIDATDPEVLRYALGRGVSILNDVRGFPDPELHPEWADSEASLVVVHSLLALERATRDKASPGQVLDSVERFFDRRLAELVRAGVREERLIVDPGMGFFLGSDPQASLAVLQRIPDLRARFGCPVLISVSRKSFLRALTGSGLEQIGPATLAAELYAARQGADYLRTHDVAALRDGLEIERTLGAEIALGAGTSEGDAPR